MRGQWLSTTRKLNRHYQSGQGGDHWTLLSGMLSSSICGFEFNNPSPHYPVPVDQQGFDKYDPSNVIVAPIYKLFNSLPTTYTQETDVRIQYGIPRHYSSDGTVDISTSASFVLSTLTPVWKYGEVRGEPYWAYQHYTNDPTNGYIRWAAGTWTDDHTNQNGIYVSGNNPMDATYSTVPPSRLSSFETEYAGKDVDVVIPVYEVLAVMDPGVSPLSSPAAIITDSPLGTKFPNEIRLKNFARGVTPVAGFNVFEFNPHSIIDIPNDGMYRYAPRAPENELGPIDINTELGVLGERGGFNGDKVLVFMIEYGVSPQTYISAGRYVDPSSGIPINMVYALRLKYLEHQVLQPATRVLSTRL